METGKLVLLQKERQPEPKKSLIASKSVKEGKKLPEICLQAPRQPDFRFICPNCLSLEVYVAWIKGETFLKGHCLDCQKDWTQGVK